MLTRQFGIGIQHRMAQLEQELAVLQAEVKQVRAESESLREQVAALQARRGPGRPRKVEQWTS